MTPETPRSASPELPRSFWKHPAFLAVAAVLLAFTGFAGYWLFVHFTHSVTDDAFVEAHIVNVAPQQVSGRLVRYLVQENDRVEQGQLLAEIDPAHYQNEVDLLQARLTVSEAQLAAEKASLARLQAEVPRQIAIAAKALEAAQAETAREDEALQFTALDVEKAIREARAALAASQADLLLAEQEYKRFTVLFKEDAVSQRRAQEATKVFHATQADVSLAEARLARALAAEKKVEVARQTARAAARQSDKAAETLRLAETGNLQIKEAESQVQVRKTQVAEAKSALAEARTNLYFTGIRAPFGGVIVKRYRHLGDFAQAGTPILSMYNPELTYVTANLEETKLQGVAPGNDVRLEIDAFREPFHGRVVWINKATGANFALIPRNDAAGEFTRVVQRVPVRIWIEKDDRWPLLRAGLSVTVYISHGPGDEDWARQAAKTMRDLEALVPLPPEAKKP